MTTPLSFNANWYLQQNPDVAAAIEAGAPFNAFEHFQLYGRADGRSASPVKDLLIVEDGVERFDLQVLDRLLVGLPADPADEPEEWFDAKTGGLRLQHLPETVYFSGIQSQIVELFWKSRHGAPLSWAEVKHRTLTASKGIDGAFKGKDWSQWIERVGHGKLRLRTSTSA